MEHGRCGGQIPGIHFYLSMANNIIFVNRYFYPDLSATSQMLSDLAFALTDGDSRVWVVTSRQTYEDPQANLPARQNQEGVEIYRVWTTHFGRLNLVGRAFDYISFYIMAFWALLKIAQSGDIIVAKTDPPLISVVALIAAKMKGAKLINWLQDVFPEVATSLGVLTWQPLIRLIRGLRNWSLRHAEINVVLGERMQEYIGRQGIERAKTSIIHNWADGNLIKPVHPMSNALRISWKLEKKFVVGYSGNMGRAHEFDTIISAMQHFRDDESMVFLFVGGGVGKKKLELAVTNYGLKNCFFMPYQPRERLSDTLSVPDIHLVSLQPSLEGLIVPSKIYGIVAAGRPIVFIGDCNGEVGRLATKYEFGFSVSVGEGKALAECLQSLKNNPEISAQMGQQGRQCFEKNFELSRAIQAWKHLLFPLLDKA